MDQVHSLRNLIDLVEGKKGQAAPDAGAWKIGFSNIFDASLKDTKAIFPDIQDKVERFITTKLPNPLAREAKYGKHDGPMTGPLAGFYHCYLHDDAILIYRLVARSVLLVCIVSHAETEGKRGKKLRHALQPFLEDPTWMGSVVETLLEKYMGTYRVETDYGEKVDVELFENPSKLEVMKLLKTSEYASLRASLYPITDTLVVWVGDRVQHHDIDHALFGNGSRHYIRMFFDKSGISMHDVPDEEAQIADEDAVKSSRNVKRAMGSDFEISYP